MFGLGGYELAIILVFAFLIFGPDKLPDMARTAGRFISQFRAAQEQMNKVIKEEVMDPIKDLEPLVNPFAGLTSELTGDTGRSQKPDITERSKTSATTPDTDATSPTASEASAADPDKPSLAEIRSSLADDIEKRRTRVVKASDETPSAIREDDTRPPSFAERRANLLREQQLRQSGETRDAEQPTGDQPDSPLQTSSDADSKPEA